MKSRSRTLTILPGQSPWTCAFKFSYDFTLKEWLKEIPGVTWQPASKAWLVPIEMADKMADMFAKNGYDVFDRRKG